MKNVTMISRRSFLKAAMAASAVSALAFTGCGGSASSTVAASSTASSAAASAAAEGGQTFKVGIVNYVDHASLNQIVESVESRLDKLGAEKGVTFDYADYYANAQADQSNLNQIGADLVGDGVDVIVAVATPTAATMLAAVEDTDIPVVYSAVTDPAAAGFDGEENITGTSDALNTDAINADNEHLMQMAEQRNINRLITYGKDENCDVWGEVISCAPFLKFRWRTESFDWHEVQTHLIGSYNIDNMLAAITIGLHFDVKPQQIDHALENYIPSNNRSQLEETAHNKLVVDAYNANPSSMAAAIENFRVMDVPHKMAILGQMGELGEVSHEEHQKVVDQLQAAGLENVWLVGDEFKDIPCSYRKFQNVEEVKEALKANQPHDHYILIKGSNSVKLFQLPELL